MMTNHISLLAGLLVGFSIAVPLGPMGLLCIQRTLTSGMRVGVSTGLGAATVNVLYGALIVFGLDQAAPMMAGGSRVLNCAGGVFLLYSAARTSWRRRGLVDHARPAVMSPLAAYGSAAAFNAANPMAPLLMVALLTPIIGQSEPSLEGTAALLLGMFTGASIWWVCLCGGIALLRARLSPRILAGINQAAGALLTVYGVWALARSAGM
jgi:threonine/homoserine/homoserine lactone efflux protein